MTSQTELLADIRMLEKSILDMDLAKKRIEKKYGLDYRLPARELIRDLEILLEVDETTHTWEMARLNIKDIVLGQK